MKQTKLTAIVISLSMLVAILAGCAEIHASEDTLQSVGEDSQVMDETTTATGSQGLAYTVNSDNTSCTVTGMGSCTDTIVIIPSAINGYDVTEVGSGAFQNCTSLTSITIPNSVTRIGENAFRDCTSLSNVTIGNRDTIIGLKAFLGCSSLKSMTYPTE